MDLPVTPGAEQHHVIDCVLTTGTARHDVVDLQIALIEQVPTVDVHTPVTI